VTKSIEKEKISMLKTIKDIINERMALQEDANIILENDELDESIILTEDTDEPEREDDDESEVKNGTPEEDSDKDEDQKDPEEDKEEVPPAEEPIEEPAEGPIEEPNEELIDEPVDVSTNDDSAELPEPETNLDDTDSILSMEIDLKSNTMKDTLPTPPASASDAIADDDIMSQRVDDGFGDEEPTGESTEEPTDGFDILSEAIDMGDTPEEPSDEAPDAGNAEENSVTKAVKDKVAEAEEPAEEPADDVSLDAPEEPAPESTPVDKKELFDKLASLTNGIEDVKKQIVNSMN
jgi:hypothetical protein